MLSQICCVKNKSDFEPSFNFSTLYLKGQLDSEQVKDFVKLREVLTKKII